MAEKKTRSYKADTLRQRAEEMPREKAFRIPENMESLSIVSFACLRDIAHE
jgi:hypothetical protein